jgi:GNAT superfamily N-acetyltransferase
MMQEASMHPDIALQKALEQNEANYWHSLYIKRANDLCGTRANIIGGAFAGMMSEIDMLACNRVLGLGMSSPATESQLDAIIDTYITAKVTRFLVQISPYNQPKNIQQMLEQKGFSHYNNWAKLYRKAEAPIPPVRTELTVVEIGEDRAEEYGKMVVQCFEWDERLAGAFAGTVGAPGYKTYFALDGQNPVGVAALYTNGMYASMAIAGTLPGHRGKGAQSALLARRIADAKALGCQHIMVETAEEKPDKPVISYRNMRKFGFEIAYLRPNYIFYTK